MDGGNGKEKNRGRLVTMSRLLKKYYASVMQPLLFVRGEKEKERENEKVLRRRPCSFSGDPGFKEQGKRGKQRRKTEQLRSAPESARTSRANSGALVVVSSSVFSSSDGSTMEELQRAIQAAIAHCKSSFANSEQQGNENPVG
ncbi:LOW QUALITY PROTEIN: putative BRI1 kinase inhibitor 1 [Curcuma longa]|uniref:LOW QUALITY PROTEIN: putative BRI1 kinase inhibitor 1 n=1 Tax=Curcuma longa TaxID=136217 RepID=UPI003D9E3860